MNDSAIRHGYCNATDGPGDCTIGDKGSWRITSETITWVDAQKHCALLCESCHRCRFYYVSLKHRECSWFQACDMLKHEFNGFLTAPRPLWRGTSPKLRRRLARSGNQGEDVSKYMRDHYQPILAQSVLVFFHLSKAGGTALCDMARLNGCTRPGPGEDVYTTNCAARQRDDNAWWFHHATLKMVHNLDYRAYLSSWGGIPSSFAKHGCSGLKGISPRGPRSNNGPAFTALEGAAPATNRCNGTVELLVVREPIDRLASLGRELLLHNVLPRADGMSVGTPHGETVGVICGNYSRMLSVFPSLFDNHLARTLLGADVYAAPIGAITQAHFQAAMERLRQVDVLFVGGKTANASQRDVSHRLGWTVTTPHLYRTSTNSKRTDSMCMLSGSQRKVAMAQNKWDLRLYAEAQRLDYLDEQVCKWAIRVR